jgi:phospholipase A-2-activating protein
MSSGNSVPTSASAGSHVDPYTGASRYSGASQQASTTSASSYMDPYTGASRYSGAPQPSAAPAPSTTTTILPVVNSVGCIRPDLRTHSCRQPKFVTFKQANVSAMQGKLYQFDDALRNEIVIVSLLAAISSNASLSVRFLTCHVPR